MGKPPAFQLYTGDWLKDPALSKCSPATRGVFFDAICAMHESDRCGLLAGTPDQLARVLRCTSSDVSSAANELSTTGAADVRISNGVVTLVNRRMRREYEARVSSRKRVAKHRGQDASNASVTDAVTPLKRSRASPSSSSSSKTHPPQPGSFGAVAGDGGTGVGGREDLREELRGAGVRDEGVITKCCAVKGLHPVQVYLLARDVRAEQRRSERQNGKPADVGAIVAHRLLNGFVAREFLTIAEVRTLAREREILTLAGKPMQGRPIKFNDGVHDPRVIWSGPDGTPYEVKQKDLRADGVVLARGKR